MYMYMYMYTYMYMYMWLNYPRFSTHQVTSRDTGVAHCLTFDVCNQLDCLSSLVGGALA